MERTSILKNKTNYNKIIKASSILSAAFLMLLIIIFFITQPLNLNIDFTSLGTVEIALITIVTICAIFAGMAVGFYVKMKSEKDLISYDNEKLYLKDVFGINKIEIAWKFIKNFEIVTGKGNLLNVKKIGIQMKDHYKFKDSVSTKNQRLVEGMMIKFEASFVIYQTKLLRESDEEICNALNELLAKMQTKNSK